MLHSSSLSLFVKPRNININTRNTRNITKTITKTITKIDTRCESGFGRIRYLSHNKYNTKSKSKALMLDMDGVILDHYKANQLIRERAEQFVQEHLNISKEEARHVNSVLYQKYGHTAIGLRKIYKKNISVDDFSNFVYDSLTMLHVQYLAPSEKTLANGKKINDLIELCFNNGIPVYVFSNAPMVWCQWACWLTRINHKIAPANMITCDHGNGGYLKPDPAVYDYVSQMLKFDELLFVDDSIKNMTLNPKWTCFHLSEDGHNKEERLYAYQNIIPIKDINEITSFL